MPGNSVVITSPGKDSVVITLPGNDRGVITSSGKIELLSHCLGTVLLSPRLGKIVRKERRAVITSSEKIELLSHCLGTVLLSPRLGKIVLLSLCLGMIEVLSPRLER